MIYLLPLVFFLAYYIWGPQLEYDGPTRRWVRQFVFNHIVGFCWHPWQWEGKSGWSWHLHVGGFPNWFRIVVASTRPHFLVQRGDGR